MKDGILVIKDFIKERLILMEALRSLSFISSLPFSPRTDPHTLLKQLRESKDTSIDFFKYLVFDQILSCMIYIYRYDHRLAKKDYVQFQINNCLEQLEFFEETKIILEEYSYEDFSAYKCIYRSEDILRMEADVLMEMAEYEESGETIFVDEAGQVIKLLDLTSKRVVAVGHLPHKIFKAYTMVKLMGLITELGMIK